MASISKHQTNISTANRKKIKPCLISDTYRSTIFNTQESEVVVAGYDRFAVEENWHNRDTELRQDRKIVTQRLEI